MIYPAKTKWTKIKADDPPEEEEKNFIDYVYKTWLDVELCDLGPVEVNLESSQTINKIKSETV